jgi:hypothetical protein
MQIPWSEGPPQPSRLTIPLPDGSSAPIPTLPPTEASLMLGIWFGPSSRGLKHISEMCLKGHIWADKLHSRPLTHSKAWSSFSLQLLPGMLWGLSTALLSSRELFKATRSVYFKCLPLLAVQRHIELPWCTLPEAYQGVGFPNFALLSLSLKLQLIQCIWGFNDAASVSLFMGYESFLMDLGMYGNLLSCNYQRFSGLVTDNTWFKNIWELYMISLFMHLLGQIISYIQSAKAIAHLWNFFHAIIKYQTLYF